MNDSVFEIGLPTVVIRAETDKELQAYRCDVISGIADKNTHCMFIIFTFA